MSWFRLYTEVMDDPKVMQLDPKVFRAWIVCLCLAKEGNDGYGVIPSTSTVAFKLHVPEATAKKYVDELTGRGLVDVSGNVSTPHNWSGRQYSSDVSTTRVQRFRNKQRNDSETFQKPPQSTEYRVQSTEVPQTPCAALPLDTDPIPLAGRNGELAVGETKTKRAAPFRAPTVEQVRAYGKEINFDIDAERFCDFYAAKGWLVGKSPMKDWKAAVRNWRGSQMSTPTPQLFRQTVEDSWNTPD